MARRNNNNDESILQAGVAGRSIRDIAQSRGMTEAAVRAVIDHEAQDRLGGVQLRRELLFEVMRLRELGQKYYRKAMDGDQAAGILYIKASIGHAVQVIHQTAPVRQQTSTEKIRAALDTLCGVADRGRSVNRPDEGVGKSPTPGGLIFRG